MTVKGNEASKDAVNRAADDEQVPSYQDAMAGGSSAPAAAPQQSATTAPPAKDSAASAASAGQPPQQAAGQHNVNLYPFPSMPVQPGYGQTPYQVDGTTRIAIVPGSAQVLPLHATSNPRGPAAGKRFLVAFFWALLLYVILGAVTGTIVQMQEDAHQPRTPPGWHHHHKGHTQVGNQSGQSSHWTRLPVLRLK